MIDAFDFDGVLNRLPKPFEIFMRYTKNDDILERAGFRALKYLILKIICRLPLILDGSSFKRIDFSKEVYVISGRLNKHEEIRRKLSKFPFKEIYLRPDHSIHETVYKINKSKELKIDLFVEDRLYVIKRLKANGINAKDVKKWKKIR